MYTLQKYTGRSTRHTCPACQQKHCFTHYVDQSNNILHKNVGICDHRNKCGYHYTPKQYFQDNPEQKKHFQQTYTPPKPQPATPLCTIPKNYLIDSVSSQSNLVRFLCSIIDKNTLESPTIDRLINDYLLGATRHQEVIYWQIDRNNKIRTGKIQGYDPLTGKRLKGERDSIDWVHSRLKKSGQLPQDWELNQCLFGEHLLTKYPDKIVALVEGEKNAIIGSAVLPQYVWIATGGKQNFKPEKLKSLTGRTVVIFPDADAYDEWKQKASQLTFCKPAVSNLIQAAATTPKYDLSDYLIDALHQEEQQPQKQEQPTQTNLQALLDKNPALQTLIDTLDLQELT